MLTHSPDAARRPSPAALGPDPGQGRAPSSTDLAATLARGKTRRSREQGRRRDRPRSVKAPGCAASSPGTLTGDSPAAPAPDLAASRHRPRRELEDELFGKRILITDRDDWPVAEVVAAYRSQSDAEFAFRQLKDPHVVSFSPMHHWTDHNIRVHVFTCVLALQIAHLMRRHADQAGLHLSVRELLDQLAGIQETVLIYPSTGGRPKARRMLTETTGTQDQLVEIFDLNRWAPRT